MEAERSGDNPRSGSRERVESSRQGTIERGKDGGIGRAEEKEEEEEGGKKKKKKRSSRDAPENFLMCARAGDARVQARTGEASHPRGLFRVIKSTELFSGLSQA